MHSNIINKINPVDSLMRNLQSFLMHERVPNRYITDDDAIMDVYVRKGIHYINGTMCHTLDIASINVVSEHRSCGYGGEFIQRAHALGWADGTLVESILNDRLYAHLVAKGWVLVEQSNPPSLYMSNQIKYT